MIEAGRREGLSHDVSVSSVVRVTMRRQNVCRPLPSPLSSPPLLLSSPSCPHNHYWSLTATWSNNSFTSLPPLQAHPVPLWLPSSSVGGRQRCCWSDSQSVTPHSSVYSGTGQATSLAWPALAPHLLRSSCPTSDALTQEHPTLSVPPSLLDHHQCVQNRIQLRTELEIYITAAVTL